MIHTGVISIHSVNEYLIDKIFNDGIDLDYEAYIEENGEDAAEDYETQNPTVILGFKKDKEGLWDVDTDAEYSLKYNGDCCTIQVVHSKYIKTGCHHCSPCYPNQANLDTDYGSLIAYSLSYADMSLSAILKHTYGSVISEYAGESSKNNISKRESHDKIK